MEHFPHLKFVQKLTGKPRFHGGGGENPITQKNKDNRKSHSKKLFSSTNKLKKEWANTNQQRKSEGLPEIDEKTTPVFLQINPEIIDAEFDLESFGIEIISEEEDGYIIGASFDNLRTLEEKINGFVTSKHGTGKIADFWQIIEGNRDKWKPEHILSENLLAEWSKIKDDKKYAVEVSIAFAKPLDKEPDPAKKGGETRLKKYWEKYYERENQLIERQNHFENFISYYGEITSSLVELEDSFGCEVLINGKGLKDLVKNYQYVFEVTELEEVSGIEGVKSENFESEIEIISPDKDAEEVVVIDSGIMEKNKYIAPAIRDANSKSYLNDDYSTADYVKGGGHGTKVAGAILYPKGISEIDSPYTLPCFIRNIRVLNKDNVLPNKYPAKLMQTIVEDNQDCNLFNLSISTHSPFRKKHMSTWAAIIDKLTYENNILFLIAAGNVQDSLISNYISNGNEYPNYLSENSCSLANPAQSSFALTVGSINHDDFEDENWISLGSKNEVSPFSRIGLGIWESIKPDVVENGGGLLISKDSISLVKQHEATSPELIRSTLHGGKAIGKDSVGTSFSTPKVTHIAAILKQLYPDENINLIRALIAQGARLPNDYLRNPTTSSIQYFGYGLPIQEKVTKNSEHRITFYNTGNIKSEEAHVYSLSIPEEIRGQGEEYDILIEVTLAYSAQVRRTRQKTKSYLSTWLDWTSSKIGESYSEFRDYIFKEVDGDETSYDKDARNELRSFEWKIKTRSDGNVQDINRNNSTLQKDWAIIKSYDLPKEISFAVRGHKGWDKDKKEVPYAIVVSLEILGANIPIYEAIRLENQIELEV